MANAETLHTGATTLDNNGPDSALCRVLARLLKPLARLCLAHGITFAAAEEILKRSFVQEAMALQQEAPEHGMVSRISTATGINRREVTRLTKEKTPVRAGKQPLASELIAHWTADHTYREPTGEPRILPRQGAAPSFEALAQKITRDVHPRSMFDELSRLGFIQYDEAADRVTLVRTDFVPHGDAGQMLGLLGDNVGDHLVAAVSNVTSDSSRHLEQAIFADELSTEAVAALRPLVTTHWQILRDAMVPAITDLIEADQRAGRKQDQRVRIGLYSFAETAADLQPPNRGKAVRRLRTASPEGSHP
jgi:hypothetical protein